MLTRLKIRLPGVDDDILNELITTAKDRILLRIGINKSLFPLELESVAVEIVTAMYNKHQLNSEGMASESVDVFSVSFVNDLLDQYQKEFDQYKKMLQDEDDSTRGKIRFI